MKIKYFFQLLLFFVAQYAIAQIGIDNPNPDASAILDLTSTSKGLLAPRMTQSERDAISSPATGLLIYQTNSTPGFYVYDGSAWIKILNTGDATDTNTTYSLSFSGTELTFSPSTGSATTIDISSIDTDTVTTNATKLQMNPVSATLPSVQDVLTWDGFEWTPQSVGNSYSAGPGLTLNGSEFDIASTVVTSNYGGSVNIQGSVMANAFVGDGSGITSNFESRDYIVGNAITVSYSNNDDMFNHLHVVGSRNLFVGYNSPGDGSGYIRLTQDKTYQITLSANWSYSSTGHYFSAKAVFQLYNIGAGTSTELIYINDYIAGTTSPIKTETVSYIITPNTSGLYLRLRYQGQYSKSFDQLYWSIVEM